MNKTVLLSIENDVAYCTFNRADAMNTYNDVMSIELLEIIREVNHNSEVRFLVLKGTEHKFMAGGDIEFFAKNLSQMPAGVDEIIDRLNETISLLQSMDKITIAVVEGPCAGVGISFMLACDLVYTAEDTKFNTGYCALGLTPDGGMSYFLSRHVGHKKALELLLTSRPFTASAALALGLVNRVSHHDDLMKNVTELLSVLRLRSHKALVGCKQLLKGSLAQSLDEQLSDEKTSFIKLSQTKAFKDCVKAFVSK